MIGRFPRFLRRHRPLLKGCQRLALFFVLALLVAGPAAGGPEHELRQSVITVIKRVSKPGLRIYRSYDDVPRVRMHRLVK